MASSYATQPAVQPPRRSFAGPIVLIILGVLFLLGNLHVIAWRSLGHYFARWWPVLIILWGLVKLVEYYQAQRQGRRAAGVGVGGVILLIFLIIIGFSASGMERVNWSAVGNEIDINDDFGGMFGQSYSFTQELEQPFPAGGSLRVVSDRGAVTVESWDQNSIKVAVAKRLRAQNQEDANKADAETRALITTAGNEITLNANTHGASNGAVESDLTIYLPRKAALDVGTRRGDVVVRQRVGDVRISDQRADITVNDVTGNVSINVPHGNGVRVDKVSGNLSLEGAVDTASISDIGGNVQVDGGVMDSIKVARVAGAMNYRSSRTELEFAKVPGELTLQSGDLNGKDIAGPIRISTRSKDIHLEAVNGELKVENSNGVVEIHTDKLPLGSMQVTNRRGDIRLMLPAKAAFQLDARTSRGDINTDFNVNVQSEGHEARANGVIGNGGPRLQLENEGGDVEVKKAG